MVRDAIKKSIPKCTVIWVESICTDDKIIENNIKSAKLSNPDYKGVDPDQAIKDFLERIEQYKKKYEELSEETDGEDCSFVKLYNVGKRVVVNNINGYLASKVVSYLMNLHVNPHPIYLVKAGETQFLLENRLGGDAPLTENGKKYAKALNEFFKKEKSEGKITEGTKIFTSTLQRTTQTAQAIDIGCKIHKMRILDELNYGVCEGFSLKELEEKYPTELSERKADKLRYRFLRGESYLDLIHRIEPVIFEIEKSKEPVIVVADTSVLRCFYAYFSKHEIQDVPFLPVPLNTVVKLIPEAYFCYENLYEINIESGEVKEQQNPKSLETKRVPRTISHIFYRGKE
jgi:Fructose-2,6-bisphosphatase